MLNADQLRFGGGWAWHVVKWRKESKKEIRRGLSGRVAGSGKAGCRRCNGDASDFIVSKNSNRKIAFHTNITNT